MQPFILISYFVANLLNSQESNIFPQAKNHSLKIEEEFSPAGEEDKWFLLPLLILLSLVLLLGEWHLYYRGMQ